jgi:hypothetical protein
MGQHTGEEEGVRGADKDVVCSGESHCAFYMVGRRGETPGRSDGVCWYDFTPSILELRRH